MCIAFVLLPQATVTMGRQENGVSGAGSHFQSEKASGAEVRGLAGGKQKISMFKTHFAPFLGLPESFNKSTKDAGESLAGSPCR